MIVNLSFPERLSGVASFDLNSAVDSRDRCLEHRLMIFDTTPGGAGLAQALAEQLFEVVSQGSLLSVNCSDCTPDSAYPSCIRTHGSEMCHGDLTRATTEEVIPRLDEI